jgi:ribosomal protein S18 acetylase RimI-like enzyme
VKGDPAVRSRLSTSRFGVPIAHVNLEPGDDLEGVLARARSGDVAMVVIRLDAGDLESARRLETAGARLCDTLVYWSRTVSADELVSDRIREAGAADAKVVETIARLAFAGYRGHFQSDPRLDQAAADEVYADWALRSCLGGSDRVWLIDDAGPAGFLTMRINSPDESEILLNAVRPDCQRRGLYPLLVAAALDASARSRVSRCIVSTQLHNVPVQKVWSRMGFEPSGALHTFHLWLDATR